MAKNPDVVRLELRLPKPLHARLVKQAKEAHRSLNSQITFLLDMAEWEATHGKNFATFRASQR